MVIGQSQMMLLRAIFCHPWDSVVVFYAEEKVMEQFRQKIVNCAGALNMPIPHLESTLIPPLDQTNSIAKFARELNLDSMRNDIEVNENDMLFYSGTVLHIRCLTTTLNFENILAYDNEKGFFTIGKLDNVFGDFELTMGNFLDINNVKIRKGKNQQGVDFISIGSIGGDWQTTSVHIDKIEFSNDVLNIFWKGGRQSSSQRKKIVKDCHLLKRIFGHYTVINRNLPLEVDRLIRSGYIPILMEEEE